jgi:hypothetical protein
MTESTAHHRRLRPIVVAIACGAVCVVALVIALVLSRSTAPPAEEATLDVPLGVEEAVVISYQGPRLVARPYRRGASVNLRIAQEAARGPVRVYDIRYVISQPGEFDLAEYLAAADGTELSDLPRFKVRGLTSLTKDIETRIREIEDVGVHVGHWYYETLAGLGVLWIAWLGGLIWIGRPKRQQKEAPPPPEPSLAERIAQYFDALARGDLSAADKARLESLLLQHWRGRLDLREDRMAAACRRMQRNSSVGPAYDAVQSWLHAPNTPVDPAEVMRRCSALPVQVVNH